MGQHRALGVGAVQHAFKPAARAALQSAQHVGTGQLVYGAGVVVPVHAAASIQAFRRCRLRRVQAFTVPKGRHMRAAISGWVRPS